MMNLASPKSTSRRQSLQASDNQDSPPTNCGSEKTGRHAAYCQDRSALLGRFIIG
jgi:hypothetical protein